MVSFYSGVQPRTSPRKTMLSRPDYSRPFQTDPLSTKECGRYNSIASAAGTGANIGRPRGGEALGWSCRGTSVRPEQCPALRQSLPRSTLRVSQCTYPEVKKRRPQEPSCGS